MPDFGAVVDFVAVLRPMYLTMRVPQRMVPVPGGFWTMPEDIPGATPELVYAGKSYPSWHEDELGEPVPGSPAVPHDGHVYRRLRRFKQVSPGRGIIVGRTWRSEGQYVNADDEQQAYLAEERRVAVYEVAVRSGHVAYYASEILLVHPDDIKETT